MDKDLTPALLADRVRKVREQHGWTWDEVARRIGITPATIRQWRLGLIKHVRPSVVRRIEELEVAQVLESQIVELDPEWRDTLRKAKLSVERILLSRNRAAIEHLISTLEVLQNYVEAFEEHPEEKDLFKAKKSDTGNFETD